MLLYLTKDINIAFDYMQNIKGSNALIISPEFGSKTYDDGMDALMYSIPQKLTGSRLVISDIVLNDITQDTVLYKDNLTLLIDVLKDLINNETNTEVDYSNILYLDANNYVVVFSWFLKTYLPNITKETAYDVYSYLLTVSQSLKLFDRSSYIVNQETFYTLFINTNKSTDETVLSWASDINVVLKYATIGTVYIPDQLENFKRLVLEQIQIFYLNFLKSTYLKLIENFAYFQESGILYIQDGKIIWKLADDLEVDSVDSITLKTFVNLITDPEDTTENQTQIVVDNFKTIFNSTLEQCSIVNSKYLEFLKMDPLHEFFINNSFKKFNAVEFVKFTATRSAGSEFFNSICYFKGTFPILYGYVSNLLKNNKPEINEFCLNKI